MDGSFSVYVQLAHVIAVVVGLFVAIGIPMLGSAVVLCRTLSSIVHGLRELQNDYAALHREFDVHIKEANLATKELHGLALMVKELQDWRQRQRMREKP